MKLGQIYGRGDGEHNGVDFVEIYKIFVTQDNCFLTKVLDTEIINFEATSWIHVLMKWEFFPLQ